MMPAKPRARTLATSVDEFEKMFAKDFATTTLRKGGDIKPYAVIPTGSVLLDVALKIGGWPVGRVCEVWGPEHAGKTTLMMMAVREAQRAYPDKMCAWVDIEQTFDEDWAEKQGVDRARLWRPDPGPQTAQEAADMVRRFVESGLCSLVIIDSVGAMIGQSEFDKDADEVAKVAEVANIVTRMVKQCSPLGARNGTTTMVVNQVRAANVGNAMAGRGPSTTTTGGWALKHITTVKVRVGRGGDAPKYVTIDGERVPVGYQMLAKVEKNKCAPYGTQAQIWLYNQATKKYGPVGVDQIGEAWDLGTRYNIIKRGGANYTFPDGEVVRTADKAEEYLRAHPAVAMDVRSQVLDLLRGEVHEEQDNGSEDLDLSGV